MLFYVLQVQVQWRSVSLQRGMQPPQPDQSYSSYRAQNGEVMYGILRNQQPQQAVDPIYGIRSNSLANGEPTYGVRSNPLANGEPTYGVRSNSLANGEPTYVVRSNPLANHEPTYGVRSHPANGEPTYGIRSNPLANGEPTYGVRNSPLPNGDPTYGILRNSPSLKDPTYSNMPRVSIHPQEPLYAPYRPQQLYTTSPPVINEEEDVVIRRNVSKLEDAPTATAVTEPFGRSTNMRLTSFKDRPQQSATLPHYPTQIVNPAYPHCSTMPLPVSNPTVPTLLGTGTSCNSFPRQHTTIPTHHNGVRLFNPSPFNKRPFPTQVRGYQPPDGGHHTFPQIINMSLKPNVQHKPERDSANFSIASSGDSDMQMHS